MEVCLRSQLSKLVSEETCKKCGNCCKMMTLWIPDTENMCSRLEFISNKDVGVYRTGIIISNAEWLILRINSPCQFLEKNEKNTYHCQIWNDDKKPLLCRTYPSNQFYDFTNKVSFNKKSYIEKTLHVVKKICPALSDKTVEDIYREQERLKNSE